MAFASKERFLATRASLLGRLGNWQDQASWNSFFELYWRLLFGVAIKNGLSETEAEEAVQETVVAVAHHIGKFKYDPARGSFKSWLLKIARSKIVDQFRKRDLRVSETTGAEPAAGTFEDVWEEEWRANLLEIGLAKLRTQIDPLQFQIFDCYVVKGWTPEKVAKTLGVTTGQVYLAKNRVGPKLKELVGRLERDGI